MLARSPVLLAVEDIDPLESALLAAKAVWNEPRHPMHLCTVYWTHVFVQVYGEQPLHDDDDRWEPLFKRGMPLLRRLEGRETPADKELRKPGRR